MTTLETSCTCIRKLSNTFNNERIIRHCYTNWRILGPVNIRNYRPEQCDIKLCSVFVNITFLRWLLTVIYLRMMISLYNIDTPEVVKLV